MTSAVDFLETIADMDLGDGFHTRDLIQVKQTVSFNNLNLPWLPKLNLSPEHSDASKIRATIYSVDSPRFVMHAFLSPDEVQDLITAFATSYHATPESE